MAIITFALQLSGCHCYGEGQFDYRVGYPYVACIRSASQTFAIYCLVLLYMALKQQPHESDGYHMFVGIRPIPKFLCIKGVVFFTYWQSILIAGLVYLDVIKPTQTWTSDNIAVGLQDILICIEMLIAAIAHCYAFKVADFRESGYSPLIPPHKVLFDVANVTDIMHDASNTIFQKQQLQLLMHDSDDDNEEDNGDVKNAASANEQPNNLNPGDNDDDESSKSSWRRKVKRSPVLEFDLNHDDAL
eukprot:CAMPEP_0202713184 /NCGR_PEP_ID=MMETSP1385-20130828/51234_1 /ASSEMBLY_ACC=CAM_ASM_000861 /TAXON_ID=933848 /ORGANISM="Elphidium margaritaceum" /LENGTH=244 /DNA_ID=CAMNT_0049373457 /DNA_START=513 /DNA_END=1247 /DNA_ORIENTATION=-